MFDVPAGAEPTEQQVKQAATTLLKQAAEPIATRPALRHLLQDIKRKLEQIIDDISVDELIEAGASEEAKRKAKSLVDSFERFIADNKDEIDALQCFYGTPYTKRLRFSDLKTLADEIKAPPRAWTPEKLWRAYETLDRDRVRGASAQRLLTDLVSLVRFAMDQDDELTPFGEHVRGAFRPLARTTAHRGPRLHARAGPLAGDDPRPHRGQRGDDGGRSRLRAVRRGGRPGSRGAGVRQGPRAAAG